MNKAFFRKTPLQGTYLLLILLSLGCNNCFAEVNVPGKSDTTLPVCSGTGSLSCPRGYKPNCPEKYKPSCVFLGKKQEPACLANYTDTTFYSYKLGAVHCKKDKE